jgi:hypothetical protein
MNTIPNYKRLMPSETKQKISQTMLSKNIKHSQDWNNKISQSLRQTWSLVPKADADTESDNNSESNPENDVW